MRALPKAEVDGNILVERELTFLICATGLNIM